MRIGLVVDQEILNYALGVVSRNSEIKLEMLCYSERIDECSFENLVVQSQDENSVCHDALVIVVQNIERIQAICSCVLSLKLGDDKTKIMVVYPSCINAKADFIVANKFDQEKLIELPSSDMALSLLSERLHTVISPKTIAKETYETNDNIEAYLIEKMYVNIFALSGTVGVFGCGYTDDGVVLNCWTNGRKQFESKVEETYLPLHTDKATNVDNVCPLVRMWASNFFHFLTDIFDKILVAEELGFTGKYMLYHTCEAEALILSIGIPGERIIWIEPDDIGKVFLINNAIIVEGFTVGSQRNIARLCNKGNYIAAELMRDDKTQYPKMLYISRIGRRKLLGVEEIIREFDFYTFIPEEHSLEEEIKFFNNADIILCPHGAATANIIFMKNGAALVETCPYDWSAGSISTFFMAKAKKVIYRQIIESTFANHAELSGLIRDYHVNTSLLAYIIKELGDHMKQDKECDTARNDADQAL